MMLEQVKTLPLSEIAYMMKTTASIFLTLLLLLAACSNKERTFTLTGHVEGLTEGEALVVIPDTAYARIDTIVIHEGQFTYELETDTTTQLLLVFPGGRLCTVFADRHTETELRADTADWEAFTLKGGRENDAWQQFRDSVRSKSLPEQRAAVKEYIRANPFSPLGAHLLNRYYAQTPEPDYEGIEENVELMSGKLQDNQLVQDLRRYLDDVIKADSGKYISTFRIKNKEGKYINAYQYGGKYLLVTFWASWQPEGLKLQKDILRLKEEKKKEKVAFINVSLDTDKQTWEDLQKNDTLPDEQTCDFDGWEGTVVKRFGVTSLPQMVLLSPQRKVLLRSARLEEVSMQLDSLLKNDKEREKSKRK